MKCFHMFRDSSIMVIYRADNVPIAGTAGRRSDAVDASPIQISDRDASMIA
jgi:hypothetical protein